MSLRSYIAGRFSTFEMKAQNPSRLHARVSNLLLTNKLFRMSKFLSHENTLHSKHFENGGVLYERLSAYKRLRNAA